MTPSSSSSQAFSSLVLVFDNCWAASRSDDLVSVLVTTAVTSLSGGLGSGKLALAVSAATICFAFAIFATTVSPRKFSFALDIGVILSEEKVLVELLKTARDYTQTPACATIFTSEVN